MDQRLQNFGTVFIVSLIFWLLLTGSSSGEELVAGLFVAAAVGLIDYERPTVFSGFRLHPRAPLSFVAYLLTLARALVLANLDMARRVLSPSLPIRPEMVQITTNLSSDLGRLVLANSITLTPGTLSVDVEEQTLTVHWIDRPPGEDMTEMTQAIAGEFERHLKGFLK